MNVKNIKLLLLTMSVVLLAACSKDTGSKTPGEEKMIAGNIVGGSKASDSFQKENGLVALVIRTEDGDHICTGTLLSKRIVLTAAHCLDGGSTIKIIVVVFTKDLNESTEKTIRYGVRGLAHELFASTVGTSGAWNDIGLVKLDQDAPADFKFAKLPSLILAPLKENTLLVQAGFGKTEAERNPATDTSGTLIEVSDIEVIGLIQDGKEMLLKEDGKGSCNGDSGGPAFTKSSDGKLTQVGINSRGTDPYSCIGVGVFTSVSAHLQWIQKNSDLLMNTK